MISFLFGDEGHGKSTYIIEKIKDDTKKGIRSFLVVPEQQTVISEKEIATLLPPSAQLYCEATNFTRLANKVFREVGGLKYNYISKSGKSLAMYRTICECRDALKEYRILKGHEKSCVSLFLGAIGELKSYSVDYEKLKNAALNTENQQFKNKLEDILLIWTTFEGIVSESYSDPLDDILMLARKLDEYDYFKNTSVYIDGFYSFTKAQLDVIYHIFKQASSVTVAFDCPAYCENGAMQYAKITDARDRLFSLCKKLNKKYEIIEFPDDYKHKSEGIACLCKQIWNFSCDSISAKDGVYLVKADNEFSECEYVASKIKELIFTGEKYSDIAVIMRNSATYRGIIDYSFDKFEIPYFYSSPTDILSMPVIKTVFSALNASSSYRLDDIISYVKCGYTDISEDDLNDLEGYMFRWNIYGKKFSNDDYWASNPDGYIEKATPFQQETLARINKTKNQIISKLSILNDCFAKKCTVRQASQAVFEFLNAHNLADQLKNEIDNCSSRQEAYELSQIWNSLISALETLVAVCGDVYVLCEDYVSLLKYALSDCEIGAIPSGVDNVTIGDAPTIRAKSIKHVFVLGVNEGVFPGDTSDNVFFTDVDKIALETMGIDLSSKNDVRADDELLAFKHAISLASHSVTVSCLKGNIRGAEMQPSIAFTRVNELLGKDFEIIDTSSTLSIDKIYTKETALEQISSYNMELGQAIREYYGLESYKQDSFTNDNLSIDKNTVDDIFGNHISLSKSSIETFALCKLKYYCDYVLKLKPSNRITFAANNIGTLNHLIIEKFFNMQKNESFDASSLTDKDFEKIIDDIINSYAFSVCGSLRISNKLKYLFEKLKKNLIIYLSELNEELSQSRFSPEYMELSLSGNGKNAPKSLKFKIGENATASLSGTADRVDIYRKDGVTYVKIIDYKSGEEKISREFISQGFGIQLFIYLFTLCKMSDSEFKSSFLAGTNEIKPAGIMYFPMNISKKDIDYDVDLESEELKIIERNTVTERIKRSGFFLNNIDVLTAQDRDLSGKYLPNMNTDSECFLQLTDFEDIYKELESTISLIGSEILSGDAQAIPKKITKDPCKYCEHAFICRRRK